MNQNPPRKPNWPPSLRLGLLLALPMLLVVNGLIWSAYALLGETQSREWAERAESRLDDALITIETMRNDLHGDLFLLAGSPNLKQALDDPAPANMDRLAVEWEIFASIKRRYDQIRWLDNQGMERLRVNLTPQGAVRVAENRLQDKSDRYYFKEAIALPVGQVYASPIDLNIEHGEIERPYKPMLRLAVPVSDSRGERQGLLLVNVLAGYLLEDLARHAEEIQGHLLLLDSAGWYLRGFSREREWGFMLATRDDGDYRFDQRFPGVWRQLVRQGSGKVDNAQGLFLFRTLRYGTEGFGQHYFLLAALLPNEPVLFHNELRQLWLSLSLAVSLMLTLLSVLFARYRICCRQTG